MRCEYFSEVERRKKAGNKGGSKEPQLGSLSEKAIELEIIRQAEELDAGNSITQHTRSFDAEKGATFAMRYKEEADDYRYFPEPDLPPVIITDEMFSRAKEKMPELPGALRRRFTEQYGLQWNEADILSEEREMAGYFESLAEKTGDARMSANWMLGTVKTYLNEHNTGIEDFPVDTDALGQLMMMVKEGKLSHSVATTQIFTEMIRHRGESPEAVAGRMNLIQQSDAGVVNDYIQKVIEQHPDKVKAYKNGKKGLMGFFMGELMKQAKNLDPQIANKLFSEALNKK